jgi:glycine/D-amino acid oxidase-like deaminating enzyme
VADSYRRATDCVEAIIRRERIDCEFERLDGYLFNPLGQWDDTLERVYAVTTRLGLIVRRRKRAPGLAFDTGPCLCFANQAQFHPLKYLHGLARAIERMGGRIAGHTRALDIAGDSALRSVKTDSGRIEAASVLVATNTQFNNRVVMHTKQAGYRSYVVALRVRRGAVPRMLMCATGAPYHDVRLTNDPANADHEPLVVGGQDHKVGQDEPPQQRYDLIETWVRALPDGRPGGVPLVGRGDGAVRRPAFPGPQSA